jgi:hypothetical protein
MIGRHAVHRKRDDAVEIRARREVSTRKAGSAGKAMWA